MKYDIKKVIGPNQLEEAKKLVGRRVFFSDALEALSCKVMTDNDIDTLEDIIDKNEDSGRNDNDYPYQLHRGEYCSFIYPAEKELVPYPVERLDELVGKAVRYKETGNVYLLTSHLKGKNYVRYDSGSVYSEDLFKEFEFLDGSPIGVEV